MTTVLVARNRAARHKHQPNYIGDNPLFIRGQTAEYDELDPHYVSAAVSIAYQTLGAAYDRQTAYLSIRMMIGA
jgi:hypothetical protein